MFITRKTNGIKTGFCIYTVFLLSGVLCAGVPFGPSSAYTWGIDNDRLDIPAGSIITHARLTIHNPVFGQHPEDTVYIHLLDNPDSDMTEYSDEQTGDYFDGYGVYLTRINPVSLLSGSSDITIELDDLNRRSSILWLRPVYGWPFSITIPTPQGHAQITYSSAMLELLDYAGTGRSFGFGLDCDGFSFDALSLELTVESMTSPVPARHLVFSAENPNRPPVATLDLYNFIQDEPARTLFVLSNDSDPDGDPLSITAITQPLYGQADIVENNTAVRYTPAAGYTGPDWLLYTVSDGSNGTATSVIVVTVEP